MSNLIIIVALTAHSLTALSLTVRWWWCGRWALCIHPKHILAWYFDDSTINPTLSRRVVFLQKSSCPGLRFAAGMIHSLRCWRWHKYSMDHRFQMYCSIRSTYCQRRVLWLKFAPNLTLVTLRSCLQLGNVRI